jgi:hypothetical protein
MATAVANLKEAGDPATWLRKVAADAFWHVLYHEKELQLAHQKIATARALMIRANIDEFAFNDVSDEECDDDDPNDEELAEFSGVPRFIYAEVRTAKYNASYHERELKDAHQSIAVLKAMMLRAQITEFTLEQAQADAQERFQS